MSLSPRGARERSLPPRRVFLDPDPSLRARRATDCLLLVWSVVGLVGLGVLEDSKPAVEAALARLFAALPGWFDSGWRFLFDLPLLWAVVLVVVALAQRRYRLAGSAGLAVVCAIGLALVSARFLSGDWPSLTQLFATDGSQPSFPAVRLALAAAVIIAVGADAAVPVRRIGSWMITLGAAGTLAAGLASPFGTIAALVVGVAAAACARLAFGTSAGQPSVGEISDGLAALGAPVSDLHPIERQQTGVFTLLGVDERQRRVIVRVYGRDAYDNQLVARLWRAALFRDARLSVGTSRARAAEREALVTLLAERAGVPTWGVLVVGRTRDDDGLLALLPADGDRPLADVPAEQLDDCVLAGAWQALERLHGANCAHGQINPSTLVVGNAEPKIVDWTSAIVTPSEDQRLADRAALLASLACSADPDRAVASAAVALGEDGAGRTLPYLQTAAFDSTLRSALKSAAIEIDDLRERLAQQIGTQPPELIKLRRLTWASAIQTGLLVFAAIAVISGLASLDLATVVDQWRDASWWWITAGFVLAQAPRFTQAITTLGSVAASLPYLPVYMMQLATGFMNLALPSSIARMTINVRFFQRHGVPPAAAVTAGVIDSFAGNAVQLLLLIMMLLFSQSALDLNANIDTGGSSGHLIAALLIALIVGVVALVAIGRVRRAIVERVRRWWPDVRDGVVSLRASRKLAYLLGGAVATELLFAAALGACVQAFGYDFAFGDLLLINLSVSLFASLIPVPGGIGAFAAVITYRLGTFYLPPIWGWFAMQWLRRNRLL
jgi:uncharacterized membrane protein YbhN (UPF0104 family)/tRNA A-37 threonylcarbamoyl transferase component Bud32